MRKSIYTILLFFCTAFFALNAQTLKQYIESAEKVWNEKNYEAALEYYLNAYDFDTSDINVAYKAAEAARMFNSYSIADSLYSQVISNESDGSFPEATLWEGVVLQQLGKYQESNDMLNLYLSEHSGEDEYLTKRAMVEMKQNDWAMAQLENASNDDYFRKLNNGINTPYSEFGSFVYNDSLYYSSLRYEKEDDDYLPNRTISKVLVTPDTNSAGKVIDDLDVPNMHSAHTALSKDGNILFYTLCDYVNANDISCDIYVRKKNSNGSWGEAMKLAAPINLDSFTSTEPTVGLDPVTQSQALYFVSDREGGQGKRDIWMTTFTDDLEFGELINLDGINTFEDDLTPQYDHKTNTLYFSSEGYLGFGGLDVFSSNYNKASGSWTSPENMGTPINSSYHDVYFFPLEDGEYAYISSNRPGSYYLDDAKEACCYDIYKARLPFLKSKLIAQTFLASSMDTVRGATVTLYPLHQPEQGVSQVHADSFDYPFKLRRNKDYVLVAHKEGYLPDTIRFSTRDLEDNQDIIKKLYLKTVDLDLLALVFDEKDSLPLKGAEVRVIELSSDSTQIKTNYDGNDFLFPIDRNKRYRIIASRKGYKSKTLVVDGSDFSDVNQIIKKLYLPIGDLSDFLPLVLFFDNDHPDPNSWNRTTKKLYSETFTPYYARKPIFEQELLGPISNSSERESLEQDLTRFFETELKKGNDDLANFLEVLNNTLKEGAPVSIYIKGYTSPRFSRAYNYALGLRRVVSVQNELMQYNGGVLKDYLDSGQLKIKQKSFGEIESAAGVNDDLNNERLSIYSVEASKERRVEIINIEKE